MRLRWLVSGLLAFDQVLDLLTLPERFIIDVAETFGQGFVDLVAGKTCRVVSNISIPRVYAAIKECIGKRAFQTVFHTIEEEINDFLNYPVIHEGREFMNMRLEDIPVIGDVINDVGKAEGWLYNNLVPSFARQKIQTCIHDGIKHPSDNPLFFILGIGVNMIQHPTILDMLLALPGAGELAETTDASEIALKAAEVAAKSADGVESFAKAAEAAEKAAKFAGAAKRTEYESAAAEHEAKARKATGVSIINNDATTVEVPHVPNEGEKVVEDAGLKAANQAELDEAVESTWDENDAASQAA
ncbi:hypothetical protein BDV39DRAFT_199827 [Aspergillus sergii]|uniref:Uncharacterized protein n=1 Tax=Aspergillus sergii TaxID=1034303 RepID=A0A5N6XKE3_9EURO|nr:hypothetical protein BDV39DRAFT_199827 [Aspergillus sergii]